MQSGLDITMKVHHLCVLIATGSTQPERHRTILDMGEAYSCVVRNLEAALSPFAQLAQDLFINSRSNTGHE